MELLGESFSGLLLVFVGVFVVTYLFYGRRQKNRQMPASLPWLPIVGSLPFLPTSTKKLAEMGFDPKSKYGKIFFFYAGSKRTLMLSGKEAIHDALVNKSTDFADRPTFYVATIMNSQAQGFVLCPYNTEFKRQHQLCLTILKRFGFGQRIMETRILMEVEELVEKVRAQNDGPFDVKQLITACVANVMMDMLYGRRFDHNDSTFKQLIFDMNLAVVNSSFTFAIEFFPVLRFIPYFKRMIADCLKTLRRVCDLMNGLIDECCQKEKTSESFVNCYVEAEGSNLNKEQLLCIVFDLTAAGMETTATTIRWAIVLIANHISVQDRLHADIDTTVGRRRLPSLDDRSRLPYVEATILELMRYKTLVPFAVPHLTLNDTEVCGYSIPRDTMVLVNLYSVHKDPAVWEEPDLFRPERFLDESGSVVGRELIVPFSLGKRSCLGEQLARQEIFLFLVALLQQFDFKPPEGQDQVVVQEEWGETVQPSSHEIRLVARA